jgi:hypothetical protein
MFVSAFRNTMSVTVHVVLDRQQCLNCTVGARTVLSRYPKAVSAPTRFAHLATFHPENLLSYRPMQPSLELQLLTSN